MSNLIIITADMHKVADFSINVKYRQPGNVVEYLPVEFEVFEDRNYYKAVPLPSQESRRLADLRTEYVFQIKHGKPCKLEEGTRDIVDDIVRKMVEMKIVETPRERLTETQTSRSL